MNKPFVPECDEPMLLVNRAALNQISLGGTLYYNDKPTKLLTSKKVNIVKLSYVYRLFDGDLSSYIVRRGDYEDYLFMMAPCGKCLLCKSKKQNDFVFRAAMESATYDVPPYFFTLTYENRHLPPHGELRYKDVQDFFKRLRRKWDRQGLKHDIRYIVAGEYGRRRGRCHYHIILFNNPYKASEASPLLHKRLRDDIFSTWARCERQSFDFDQCRGGAAAYATKYMAKVDIPLHGHWTKPFVHSSNGKGGIGSRLIDTKKSYCRANPSVREIEFIDNNGKIQKVGFGSYVANRVWPSPTRLVPPKVRSLYKQFCDILTIMVRMDVYTFEEAYDIAEEVRPYVSVVPNRMNAFECRKPLQYCKTADRYYRWRYSNLLQYLAKELHEHDGKDVDGDYIKAYYNYKSLTPQQVKKDVGFKKMRIRERNSLSIDKEKL